MSLHRKSDPEQTPKRTRRGRLRVLALVAMAVAAVSVGTSALAPTGTSLAPATADAYYGPAEPVIPNSLHRMPDGRWWIANLYTNFTWSGDKYCYKHWYSGPTSNGPFDREEGYFSGAWAGQVWWCH